MKEIQVWLDDTGKEESWSNKTWNGYRDLLAQILDKATVWSTDKGTPRLARNPLLAIERRVCMQPEHFKQRIYDNVEARLVRSPLRQSSHRLRRREF